MYEWTLYLDSSTRVHVYVQVRVHDSSTDTRQCPKIESMYILYVRPHVLEYTCTYSSTGTWTQCNRELEVLVRMLSHDGIDCVRGGVEQNKCV